MTTLATLFQFKQHLGIDPTDTTEDGRLLDALRAATAHLHRETRRQFIPRWAAMHHIPLTAYPDEVALRDDLLELRTVTDAAGTVPLDSISAHPTVGVIALLRRTDGPFAWGDDGVFVTGVWGWHDQPSEMWQQTGDIVADNPLTESAGIVTVTDADATMSDGLTPRFSVGALLRAGDEFMRVTAVDAGANTLTVARGVHGTTAVEHPQDTALWVYRPPFDVLTGALQLAAWLYRQPDTHPPLLIPAQVVRTVIGLRRLTVMG